MKYSKNFIFSAIMVKCEEDIKEEDIAYAYDGGNLKVKLEIEETPMSQFSDSFVANARDEAQTGEKPLAKKSRRKPKQDDIAYTYDNSDHEVKLENEESPMSQFSHSIVGNAVSDDTQSDEKPTTKKSRGRPKGSKARNKTHLDTEKVNSTVPCPYRYKSVNSNNSLPKMRPNVHNIKLKQDQIDELKKSKATFVQHGVCFRIAPELDRCIECKKAQGRYKHYKSRDKGNPRGEVDCRFYQFRKLRYNDDGLEVAGFLDPNSDPIDVDRYIWLPHSEKRVKTLSPQNARFILIHVGEQLCDLIEKETVYYQKYKSDEKPVIWKRLIE